MKRFVNNVPLGTITALIWGYTPIIIENRKECNVYNDNAEDTRRWTGLVKDLYRANDEIKYKNVNPEDIRIIEPCCGSGHILVYVFDLLYKMYEEKGYHGRLRLLCFP